MDRLMREVRYWEPEVTNRRRSDDISTLKKTMRQHYRARRKELGLEVPRSWDRDLKSIFAYSPQKPEASRFISHIRPDIRREVATGLGEYQYHVDSLIQKMQRRAGELQLGAQRLRCHDRGQW